MCHVFIRPETHSEYLASWISSCSLNNLDCLKLEQLIKLKVFNLIKSESEASLKPVLLMIFIALCCNKYIG